MKKSISKQKPELEHDYQRNPSSGYKFVNSTGYLRCFEHGAPSPLIRWHNHEDYELHLIANSSGKMFIGDYIGDFHPGSLVLTGPFLPHNWVSNDLPEDGIGCRDIGLQFSDKPFRKSCELLPELSAVLPLFDRAKHGVEFFGISDFAQQQLDKIKTQEGIHSFNEFLLLMTKLSNHTGYQILSNTHLHGNNEDSLYKFKDVTDYINENYTSNLSMIEFSERSGMDSSNFSRCFRKATGINFTEYVNHVRINRACHLLSETDKYIGTIGYDVGYNNVSNFNRRFVEIKKITPSEYRKHSQSNLAKYSS